MEFENKRAMTQEEDKYSFSQSQQINSMCGLIGHLRSDMDTDGNGFFFTWFDFRTDLKTDEFKKEFDSVVNTMREEGDILHNRRAMAAYCYSTPQSKMETEQDYYGVRVDTEKYTYFIRMNPNKGEYNAYIYCYIREWVSQHIAKARVGIRFIDPDYNTLFTIPDGGSVIVRDSDGNETKRVCRYIDATHLEIGDSLYHICELAERLAQNGSTVRPAAKDVL